jgi:hypothetical protein
MSNDDDFSDQRLGGNREVNHSAAQVSGCDPVLSIEQEIEPEWWFFLAP